jgi:hypothetical protein
MLSRFFQLSIFKIIRSKKDRKRKQMEDSDNYLEVSIASRRPLMSACQQTLESNLLLYNPAASKIVFPVVARLSLLLKMVSLTLTHFC